MILNIYFVVYDLITLKRIAAIVNCVMEIFDSSMIRKIIVSHDIIKAEEHRRGVLRAAAGLAEHGAVGVGYVQPPRIAQPVFLRTTTGYLYNYRNNHLP